MVGPVDPLKEVLPSRHIPVPVGLELRPFWVSTFVHSVESLSLDNPPNLHDLFYQFFLSVV